MENVSTSPASDLFAARDRVRRARAIALTPRERLQAMWRLIAESRAALERHPQGREHFLRRNFRARATRHPAETRCDDA